MSSNETFAYIIGNEPGKSNFSNEEMVLKYLKDIQDSFSTDKFLVPAMEDNSAQTFNNALTAMALILYNERERAERILDFYASRIAADNQILNSQNFFYNYQARGFFQNIDINTYTPSISDRWMGDNTWLLLSFKYYEYIFGFNNKPSYQHTTNLLKDLLLNFFIEDPYGHGGFVRHGWRWGPRSSSYPINDYQLHEIDSLGNPVGHEEGNINAYAVFKMFGEFEKALMIKQWLDNRINELNKIPGLNLPLDLYSWRSLAFTHESLYYKMLAMAPENDSRFKKQLTFMGKSITGFYSFADASVQNIWLDGVAHMVCAFYAAGYHERGDYYLTQLDSFLIPRYINKSISFALPYTANQSGSYAWVDIDKGFSSTCAWYLFAKKGFNPFTFEQNRIISNNEKKTLLPVLNYIYNYPNPFNNSTTIVFSSSLSSTAAILIYDILGNKIKSFTDILLNEGENSIIWDGHNDNGAEVISGVYIYVVKYNSDSAYGKMILIK